MNIVRPQRLQVLKYCYSLEHLSRLQELSADGSLVIKGFPPYACHSKQKTDKTSR